MSKMLNVCHWMAVLRAVCGSILEIIMNIVQGVQLFLISRYKIVGVTLGDWLNFVCNLTEALRKLRDKNTIHSNGNHYEMSVETDW